MDEDFELEEKMFDVFSIIEDAGFDFAKESYLLWKEIYGDNIKDSMDPEGHPIMEVFQEIIYSTSEEAYYSSTIQQFCDFFNITQLSQEQMELIKDEDYLESFQNGIEDFISRAYR